MSVNWDAVGAVAEAVGAAGVIASLLYLAVQLRAGARASAVESKLATSRMYTDFLDSFIKHPDINALFLKGRKDLGSLSPEEYVRFSNLALQAFSFFSATHFQFRCGTLDDSGWFEQLVIIRYWLHGPGCRDWWEQVGRHMFGREFVEFVRGEMQGAGRP